MAGYKVLQSGTLDAKVSFQRPRQVLPQSVSMNSPAIDVMTDLTRVAAVCVSANTSLADAEQSMIASGIRLLLVVNQFNHVIGIITSRDLAGEKVVQHLKEHGGNRNELTVRDLMTPQHRIQVLEAGDVVISRVGDIVETLKDMGRQHALVVDRSRDGAQTIRGILSATQIGRQLGTDINTSDKAGTFTDLAGTG